MLLKSCYGVDRQGDRIVAVLAQRNGGRVTCTAVNTERVASFSTGSIAAVAAMPTGRCLTRWIETPFTSAAKAEAVLPTLLDVQLPFPLESCHYVCVSMEIGSSSSRALTAAVRHSDLDAELKALATSGIDPVRVDCEPLALWTQALHELPASPANVTRAILYLGDDSFRMAVGQGASYLGGHATRPDDTTQLVRFLKLYEKPDAPGNSLEWWLCGPGAVDSARVDTLRAALVGAGGGSVHVLQAPLFFLARAVATRALLAGPLRCNLRMGAATHPAMLAAGQRRTMATACLGLAAGLLLIATNLGSSFYHNHTMRQMDQTFRALADSLSGTPLRGQKGEQALQFVKNALHQKQGEMAPFILRAKPAAADILAAILSSAHDHHVNIEHLVIDAGSVSIDGACTSMTDCMALADTVRLLGCPVSVREAGALPDGRKGFSMTAAPALATGVPST